MRLKEAVRDRSLGCSVARKDNAYRCESRCPYPVIQFRMLRVRQTRQMAHDAWDALEFLGRFTIFSTFVFNRRFRQAAIEAWWQEGWLGRILDLLDGLITASVGLLPLALVAAAIRWWPS